MNRQTCADSFSYLKDKQGALGYHVDTSPTCWLAFTEAKLQVSSLNAMGSRYADIIDPLLTSIADPHGLFTFNLHKVYGLPLAITDGLKRCHQRPLTIIPSISRRTTSKRVIHLSSWMREHMRDPWIGNTKTRGL